MHIPTRRMDCHTANQTHRPWKQSELDARTTGDNPHVVPRVHVKRTA